MRREQHHAQSLFSVSSPSSSRLLTHFLSYLLEKLLRLSSWGLPSFGNFSISLALDMTLQIKIHRSQISHQVNEVDTRCYGLENRVFLCIGQPSSDWTIPSHAGTNGLGPILLEVEFWRIRDPGESWEELLSQKFEVRFPADGFLEEKKSNNSWNSKCCSNHDIEPVQWFFYRSVGVCSAPMTAIVSVHPTSIWNIYIASS